MNTKYLTQSLKIHFLTKMPPSSLSWLSSNSKRISSIVLLPSTSHLPSTYRKFCRASKIKTFQHYSIIPTFWFFKSSLNSSNSFSTLTWCSSTLPRKLVTFSFYHLSEVRNQVFKQLDNMTTIIDLCLSLIYRCCQFIFHLNIFAAWWF